MPAKRSTYLTHPGEFLKIELLGIEQLTVADAAKALKIPRQRLQALIDKKSNITPQMAMRLGRLFSTSAEFWLNLQQIYDLRSLQHIKTFAREVTAIKPLHGPAQRAAFFTGAGVIDDE